MEISNALTRSHFIFSHSESELFQNLEKGLGLPPTLKGQFSFFVAGKNELTLVRDPLGINKFFYSIDKKNSVIHLSHSYFDLLKKSIASRDIFSVSPGSCVKISYEACERTSFTYTDLYSIKTENSETFNLQKFKSGVRKTLQEYFEELGKVLKNKKVFVCLSGGLDSTVIALYAKRYLNNPAAVTFSFSGTEHLSDDFRAAEKIANSLGMNFEPIFADYKFQMERLESLMVQAQDYRDFNIHCAWVNDCIGEALKKRYGDKDLVVLTGDLMNEYVADYTEVNFAGQIYYRQPRMSLARRRRFFVYGLDTSDREGGVFAHYGITTVQPYHVVAQNYMTVPNEVLEQNDSKLLLNKDLLEDHPCGEYLAGKKIRAQVGGNQGGVLGLFHRAQINDEILLKKWKLLAQDSADNPLINYGRYRS